MNEELKKFADSLMQAQRGIQFGLMTQAKTKEGMELLAKVDKTIGGIASEILAYVRKYPTDITPR